MICEGREEVIFGPILKIDLAKCEVKLGFFNVSFFVNRRLVGKEKRREKLLNIDSPSISAC